MLSRLAQALADVRPGGDWTFQHVVEEDLVFERCWRPYREGDYRLHVHRIPPAPTRFWHPHRQPMAVLVLGGPYELQVARNGSTAVARIVGSGPFWYELTHAESWHAIRALGPVHSVMLGHLSGRISWMPSLGPFTPPTVSSGLETAIDQILAEGRGYEP